MNSMKDKFFVFVASSLDVPDEYFSRKVRIYNGGAPALSGRVGAVSLPEYEGMLPMSKEE